MRGTRERTARVHFFLSLANIANEVAEKVFCEATIGSRDDSHSETVRELIDTPDFRLRFFPDVEIIEMLGALKNIVSMLAGFSEGLEAGFNTRAAVRRAALPAAIRTTRVVRHLGAATRLP